MTTEAAILGVIALVLAGQMVLVLQIRDRIEKFAEEFKKAK